MALPVPAQAAKMTRHVAPLLLLAALAAFCAQGAQGLTGFEMLVNAVNQANANALACVGADNTCLGEAVTIQLHEDVFLQGPLPVLNFSAHLVIQGVCSNINLGFKCIVDGQLQHSMFPPLTPDGRGPALLEMRNLVFQKVNGGVLANTFSAVVGIDLVFRNNINGVILADVYGGAPAQTYTNCQFLGNINGSAVRFGAFGRYNGAYNGTGFTFRQCLFKRNIGGSDPTYNAGAVVLAGWGTHVFEQVQFIQNVGGFYGGAVFVSQNTVRFRGCSFVDNVVAGLGFGGAVYGESTQYFSQTTTFCGTLFEENTAPGNGGSGDSLQFVTKYVDPETNPRSTVTVNFCNTAVPQGSVFAPPPLGIVTTDPGHPACLTTC